MCQAYGLAGGAMRVPRRQRPRSRLAPPGAAFLVWAFHAARAELPWISFNDPSKLGPGPEPVGAAFGIERLPRPEPSSRFVCFLMERRP